MGLHVHITIVIRKIRVELKSTRGSSSVVVFQKTRGIVRKCQIHGETCDDDTERDDIDDVQFGTRSIIIFLSFPAQIIHLTSFHVSIHCGVVRTIIDLTFRTGAVILTLAYLCSSMWCSKILLL